MAVGIIIGIVSAIAGAIAEQAAAQSEAQERKKQLEFEKEQVKTAAVVKSQQRAAKVKAIMAEQEASAARKGTLKGSQSFQALQAETFNQFAQDEEIGDLNKRIQVQNIKNQIKAIQKAQMVGLIFGTGKGISNVADSIPSGKKADNDGGGGGSGGSSSSSSSGSSGGSGVKTKSQRKKKSGFLREKQIK